MKRGMGFTVIELVVAITIVGLLVAVAVASYQDHMTRKARGQARKALIEAAEWVQQQRARTGTFLVKLPMAQTPFDGDAIYRIGLAAAGVNATDPKAVFPATTAENYTLLAVPVDAEDCGVLLLDSTGRTGVTGANARVADCWR